RFCGVDKTGEDCVVSPFDDSASPLGHDIDQSVQAFVYRAHPGRVPQALKRLGDGDPGKKDGYLVLALLLRIHVPSGETCHFRIPQSFYRPYSSLLKGVTGDKPPVPMSPLG